MKGLIVFVLSIILFSTIASPTAESLATDQTRDLNPWGKILKESFETYSEIHGGIGEEYYHIIVDYSIVGYGDHFIFWELEYNVSHHDGNYSNATIGGSDYLIMILNPIIFVYYLAEGIFPIKMRAVEKHEAIFSNVESAIWEARLYIDNWDEPVSVVEGEL